MKNDINTYVMYLGRIYENIDLLQNNFKELESLNNTCINDMDSQCKRIVAELEKNRVLEIALYNLKQCKESRFQIKLIKCIEKEINSEYIPINIESTKILKESSNRTEIMLIKGIAISHYYPSKYVRHQNDIDIQVKSIDDFWKLIDDLNDKYEYDRLKLHLIKDSKFTSTIDLIPKEKKLKLPDIDIHLTPYYIWGSVVYFEDLWNRAEKKDNFFIPCIEDMIVMLCAHFANQWMYRMRDVNDLYILIKHGNFDWEWVKKYSKKLNLFPFLKLLLKKVDIVYGTNLYEKMICNEKIVFKEKLFLKNNFGKESIIGSLLIEMSFVYQNYKIMFNFLQCIKNSLKNTIYMCVYNNRAYSIKKNKKKYVSNEIYVLKKKSTNYSIDTKEYLDDNFILCNKNKKNEFFISKSGNWVQVPYHSN